MAPPLRRWAVLTLLAARVATAQAELTPPPLPPPEPLEPAAPQAPAPTQPPPPAPGVLVPRAINNPPLNAPPQQAPTPTPAPPEEPERFGRRFGPMGHFALNHVNALWSTSPLLPGFAGSLGLRFALLPRRETSEFNVAAGAFFGVESVNWTAVLSPGLRVELLGAKGPVLIPYLSLSAFAQLLVPVDGGAVTGRVGLGLAWNIVAASANGWGGGWGGGNWGSSASALWFLIPAAVIAAMIVFGDVRVYLQPDPRTGGVLGGLSLGLGF